MQVHLGQTLFGAALGIVTAAGLAAAMATANGSMEVRKRCFGSPAASTAVVSAKQYRTISAKAQTAPAFALVSGKGTAYFYGVGLGNADANAQGILGHSSLLLVLVTLTGICPGTQYVSLNRDLFQLRVTPLVKVQATFSS